MGAVYFYHLTETPVEATLPMLVSKSRDAGWRVLVRGPEGALLPRLDDQLWKGDPTGFVPHGMAGGPHDDMQPVLLGTDTDATGFDCVMSVGGAEISAQEINAAERACILFDGHDQAALSYARTQWKALTEAGCQAQYWAQDAGSWVKKAESGD